MKVVNRTGGGPAGAREALKRFASAAARCSATTVLPVPADPLTRAGPAKRRSTSVR